jgi:uroporphyrinogen decarboxylase
MLRPNIEELKKTLLLRKAEYIPLVELGIHPKIKEMFLNRTVETLKDDVEFWNKAGYDYIKLQPIAEFNVGLKKNESQLVNNLDSMDFNWANEGKGLIHNFNDFEEFIFPLKTDFNYSRFEEVHKHLPGNMGVIGQYGDIFTMTWEIMGFESFSFSLYEQPELVKSINDILGNLVISMFEYFVQSDIVDIIWYSDDIAYANGLLVSPETLDEYFFPWLKKIGDMAAKYNKPFIYHSDGLLYPVIEKIIDCGVNALHPIEPKAMNIQDVRDLYGDRLCLIGNIDVDLLARGTIEEVRKQVLENIRFMSESSGYCLGSGNSIPAYINFENYLEMIKTVKEIR